MFVVPPRQLAGKGHGTKATLERSLPGMRQHVILEVHFLREGPRAQVAAKWSLAGVDAEVNGQAATRCEGLVAVAASVLFDVHIFRGAQATSANFCV